MAETVLIYDLNKVAAELCKREFSFFAKEFWGVVIAEELVWEPHMDVLCDEIQKVYERVFLQPDPNDPKKKIRLPKPYDLIINIPPGTSKSTIVTIMAPAWAWTRDASLRMITGSYSDSLATEHSTKSRDIITCDKYKIYFPEVHIKDHKGLKTNYETTANGQRFATSVGGTVTGVHGHVNTIDDPLNPKQAASIAECKAANDWMDKTLSMRKVDKSVTVTILIMQRLAVNDCTGHLLSKKKINVRHICLPAEISNNVSPKEYLKIYVDGLLSPKRLGKPVLEEANKDLGSDGYAGQMAQRPSPEGGDVWQKWFREVPDDLFPDIEKASDVSSDWDTAFTSDENNAATAFMTSGVIQNQIFIFDFDWQWLEFPAMIKWMKAIRGPHYIEAKASGKSAKQTLQQQGVIAIEVKVKGGSDKVARARAATPTAESGIVFIKKSMADRLYNDEKQGILHFPKGPFKDLADVLAQMLQRRAKKGKIVIGNARASQAEDISEESLLDLI
jgi:predicted phage terminase large subunit-like protein